MEFKCGHCSTILRASELHKRNNWPIRCVRCGAVHTPGGDAISPRMCPVPDEGVQGRSYSPWQCRRMRPVAHGHYECKFPKVTHLLHWDGRHFTHQGKRVDCRSLISWRGVWAS